jgi:predicted ArsR family transcriptional regulator
VEFGAHNRRVRGEQQRLAILDRLRDAAEGLDVNELGTALALHPNTVRWHVGALADAGLVAGRPERRHARGRPSVVYRLTSEGMTHGRDDYRLLATMLTDAVAPHAAYETGVRWGELLHEPGQGIAELMNEQGFEAEQQDDTIAMRHCPFYALAKTKPQVVCSLHRGIMDGALAAEGSATRVERLDAFVEPTLCIAHLAVRRPARRGASRAARRASAAAAP